MLLGTVPSVAQWTVPKCSRVAYRGQSTALRLGQSPFVEFPVTVDQRIVVFRLNAHRILCSIRICCAVHSTPVARKHLCGLPPLANSPNTVCNIFRPLR